MGKQLIEQDQVSLYSLMVPSLLGIRISAW